jgi:uncharacterized protein (TIGR03437 family)
LYLQAHCQLTAVILALATSAAGASTVTSNLCNTGVAAGCASETPLALNGAVDSNFTTNAGTYAVTYYTSYYIAGTTTAHWITTATGPTASPNLASATGLYAYKQTVTTSGAGAFTFTGSWATDNCGTILVNNGSSAIAGTGTTIGGGAVTGCSTTNEAYFTGLTAFSFTVTLNAGANTLEFDVWNSASSPTALFVDNLRVTPAGFACTNSTAPVITSIDSASAYGGYKYFASGSWLEIKGTNLADPSDPRLTAATNPGQWTSADFTGSNAPTALDGVSVSINGKAAYVWYLSTGQLNVQAPEDTATGNVAIMVANCKAASAPITFARRTLAPGFLAPSNYTAGGTQYMVATFASDGAYVLNTSTGAAFGLNCRPAKPGDLIVAYGIGFGDVTPSILPGLIVGASNALVNPIKLSFGSTPATLTYSGLAGSFVGLYEFYITVPSTLGNGDYQINITQNGTAVPQTMYLTVHN